MFEVVILIATSEITQVEFNALLPFVSSERQEQIRKFQFYRDKQNCLLGDVLARIEICRATKISNNQLQFSVNAYGKPYLNNSPHIHFNISHTGHYVACVVADEPVGIDVELIKNVNIKIAKRFFTPDETAYIIEDRRQAYRFYEVWTKKESRIKWEGKGLYKPLPSFSVFEFDQQCLTYHKVFHNDKAICHVCSTKQTSPVIKVIKTEALIQSSIKL